MYAYAIRGARPGSTVPVSHQEIDEVIEQYRAEGDDLPRVLEQAYVQATEWLE
jgi:hypothetical protein